MIVIIDYPGQITRFQLDIKDEELQEEALKGKSIYKIEGNLIFQWDGSRWYEVWTD